MASEPRTITYKTVGKLGIPLDLVLPPNAKNSPILLWFHGGGLLQGDRTAYSPHMLEGVTKYNYALVSADYRLAPQVGIQEIFEDVSDCIAYIRNRLPKDVGEGVLDPSRLCVSGSSAGGYLAFLSGLYVNPKPKVILPIYPITDPLGTFFTTSQPTPWGRPRPDPDELAEFLDASADPITSTPPVETGGQHKRNNMYFYMMQEANLAELLHIKPGDKTYRIASNIFEKDLPPTYIVHGDVDLAVGVEQADEVAGVMFGLGKNVKYERLHGVDHLFDVKKDVQLEKMYEFMLKHL